MANANDRIIAVVLTALELEYHAVREYLTDLKVWAHTAGTLFETGTVRGADVRVALAVTGEGNQASAVVTERASAAFAPEVVLVVGVAGALHADIDLGDVVVATRIYGYHGGKEDRTGFHARPRAWDAPHHLEQHARYLTRTAWWDRLLPEYPGRPFKIHLRPVLAGEVVLDSRASPLAQLVRRHYNDAAAVEMESAGASLAARLNRSLPLLTVRGISDRADGNKAASDLTGWQSVAASRAAAFALALVVGIESAARTGTDRAAAVGPGSWAVERAEDAVGGTASGHRVQSVSAIPRPTTWQRHAFVDHDRLFGVGQLVDDVSASIISRTGHAVVSLFGEGGIGKTALAHDAVVRSTAENVFSRIAWATAAQTGGALDLIPAGGGTAYWLDVVKDLANQLNFDLGLSRALWTKHFGLRMDSLGPDERVLAVIDNIETIEDASSVIRSLHEMGVDRPHKLIVTTRWQLLPALPAVTEYRLRPLEDISAVALIRHLGAADPDLRSADERALRPILDVTDGNPFLIKLVVRHFLSSHLPLDRLLNEFRQLGGLDDERRSLAGRLRSHLYLRSLRELERRFGAESVMALMSSFCVKGKGDMFTYDELSAVSGLANSELFSKVLTGACQLSLVTAFGDSSTPGKLDRAYTIHGLLYEFTCGQSSGRREGDGS
ncbi:phosphorylase family protein [Phytohabitans suffuscus]|nr:NB-ARC domain-containing protein [Phytohabitans suffuscus]